jgi:hypothetical protein
LRFFASSSPAFQGLEVGGERRLGIDHDVLAAGQLDDQVGTQAAVLGVGAFLLEEIAVVEHAGHFDHPLQLQLAPATTRLRRAQGFHQIAGLAAQQVLCRGQRADLLGQRGVGVNAGLLDALDLQVELLQRGLHRRHQFADRELALLKFPLGQGLLRLKRTASEFEEALVVFRQRIRRQRLEGIGEARTRGLQRGLALGKQGALTLEFALQRGAPYRQRRFLRPQAGQFGFALRQPALGLAQARGENKSDQAAAEQQAHHQCNAHFHVMPAPERLNVTPPRG